ncbi:ANTAR domain-containing response regulator [Ethanoligenens harbinense]|uniref:ANTAR domain protein n=1 Tax=Ethanoligenens harbinense (strain DSM 18485 / JCM 12961 / CGMCC 1.5033 / YUAN-3) TaxID=663278 RepID=E6U8J6_ETHHY|nr:ANTAR domain-containing protein [Ethanoligenens harbinense]ADU25987.1 ANTAR domain protein [Ethanoligenens harbinense YUAN-3]
MSDGMLVVCGQRAFCKNLCDLIASSIAIHPIVATSGAEARRKTSMHEMEAVLLAGKLPDENTLDLALELSQSGVAGVMIVIDRGTLFEAHEVLDGSGVTILANPLTKDALIQAIRLVMKVAEGGGTLDRAKLMLVQQKGWTEPQAHRYIQKLSMDKRLPRELAAQLVIKALEREQQAKEES